MTGRCSGEKFSPRGMYIRSTSDILPKRKDIRSSYISPDWNDMRSIVDITKLSEMPKPAKLKIRRNENYA